MCTWCVLLTVFVISLRLHVFLKYILFLFYFLLGLDNIGFKLPDTNKDWWIEIDSEHNTLLNIVLDYPRIYDYLTLGLSYKNPWKKRPL